ncbi:MAG: hypothetical protein KDB01_19465 [Planctomycetaceae bacterium]|nr:hypothetical protein [Planctomycetaceae bacterium]
MEKFTVGKSERRSVRISTTMDNRTLRINVSGERTESFVKYEHSNAKAAPVYTSAKHQGYSKWESDAPQTLTAGENELTLKMGGIWNLTFHGFADTVFSVEVLEDENSSIEVL